MYKIVVRSERNKTFQELQDMFYSLHILMIQIGGGGGSLKVILKNHIIIELFKPLNC